MAEASVREDEQNELSVALENIENHSFDETDSTIQPPTEHDDTSAVDVGNEKGTDNAANIEEEQEEILSDDAGMWKEERTGMARRVRDIGLRPAWWKERIKQRKHREINLAPQHLNSPGGEIVGDKRPPPDIPLDIASCILSLLTDLQTLRDAILVSQVFTVAYRASRGSITRSVLRHMFGSELMDRVLMFAVLINRSGTCKNSKGKIVLKTPGPHAVLSSPILRAVDMVFHTLNIWVELWETRGLWEYAEQKRGKYTLGPNTVMRFKRGILNYWIFSRCARASIIWKGTKDWRYPTGAFEGTEVLRRFSHFELLETRSIFCWFKGLVETLGDSIEMGENNEYCWDWTYYGTSLGPIWLLMVLDRYELGFAYARLGAREEGYYAYDARKELLHRGIGMDDYFDVFTAKGHRKLAKWFAKNGMNGNDVPTKAERLAWVGNEDDFDDDMPEWMF